MRRIVIESLKEVGLQRSGRVARHETDELVWIVELDASPRGHRLRIDVGCAVMSLPGGPLARRANDCHVYVALENLPFEAEPPPSLERFDDYRSLSTSVLDERVPLDDHERTAAIRRIVAPLGHLVAETKTTDGLRSLYADGILHSAFVDRELRAMLEGDG